MKYILTIITACIALSMQAQQALVGTWTGKLNVGPASLSLVLNITQEQGTINCTLDSPDQSAKGIKTSVGYCKDDSISVAVPMIGASYSGRCIGDELKGTFTQMGHSFELNFKRGVEVIKRPQTPVAPFPYTTQEVTFSNEKDSVTLAGTLTLPVGYDHASNGSVPLVIMVSGSGLQNRDEEIFEHKPFLVAADYLARNGIASLRYDDRGFGKSTGKNVANATTEDFARDAQAAYDYIKSLSLNKVGKVGIWGHSEGGDIAFMLGARGKADFIVSLAGVGVRCDTALTAQANRLMQLNGMPGTATTKGYRSMVLLQNQPWFNWFINYDPTPDIAATRCPVFAANGDKDCQVISELNLGGIKAALPATPGNHIVEYPGLNHLFQECTTGGPTEYRTIEQTISPQLLKDAAEWIKNLK